MPHWVFGVLLGFGLYLSFLDFFYLSEHLGSLLVDLARHLSFCLDLPLKICEFITYWSLDAVNIKKIFTVIINAMIN